MSAADIEKGFIVFDKSQRSLQGIAPLLAKYPQPTNFVTEWLHSDNEILLWVLAVAPESCRVVAIKHADDLLGGALEEFADELGESVRHTRIATGPLGAELARKVRERWKRIGGLISGT